MTRAIVIRDAMPSDAQALSGLLQQLGYPTAPDIAVDRLNAATEGANGRVMVAEVDGVVKALISLYHIRTLHRPGNICRITALVVDETARGTGVGRALVDETERHSRAAHCIRVEVTSAAPRVEAHAFYEKLGYTEYPKRFIKDL